MGGRVLCYGSPSPHIVYFAKWCVSMLTRAAFFLFYDICVAWQAGDVHSQLKFITTY